MKYNTIIHADTKKSYNMHSHNGFQCEIDILKTTTCFWNIFYPNLPK